MDKKRSAKPETWDLLPPPQRRQGGLGFRGLGFRVQNGSYYSIIGYMLGYYRDIMEKKMEATSYGLGVAPSYSTTMFHFCYLQS